MDTHLIGSSQCLSHRGTKDVTKKQLHSVTAVLFVHKLFSTGEGFLSQQTSLEVSPPKSIFVDQAIVDDGAADLLLQLQYHKVSDLPWFFCT
jgi:hypothetical protein